MGVPTSEVGYTPAIPWREDHEVHKDMWWHWTKKKVLVFSSYGRGSSSQLVQAVDRFVTPPLSGTPVIQALPRGVMVPQGVFWW